MTQPRDTFSQDDFAAAQPYVQRKLATQPYWLDNFQAQREWASAKRDPLTPSICPSQRSLFAG